MSAERPERQKITDEQIAALIKATKAEVPAIAAAAGISVGHALRLRSESSSMRALRIRRELGIPVRRPGRSLWSAPL